MLWGIIGIIILGLVSWDVFWTTLLIVGGGPLTNKITSWVWKFFLHFHKRKKNHKLLSYGGLVVILLNLFLWVGLTWMGWVFIFSSHEQAVLQSETLIPADLASRVYFTGFTLITLGIGDYVPGSGLWQILTVVASTNGFIFVTLAITYLLPIVSAVVEKRKCGAYIFSLGSSPAQILLNAWNGNDYRTLSPHLNSLIPQVLELGEKHLAYPVLHCFHTYQRETATAPNIVALDEALTIMSHATTPQQQPDKLSIEALRYAISIFLITRNQEYQSLEEKAPPMPDLGNFQDKRIDLQNFRKKVEELEKRRKFLLSLVLYDGWTWDDVIVPEIIHPKDLIKNPTLLWKN